jgi:hypothetical protein
MTDAKKPNVPTCANATVSGIQELANPAKPADKTKTPAATMDNGATQKKAMVRPKGGARS